MLEEQKLLISFDKTSYRQLNPHSLQRSSNLCLIHRWEPSVPNIPQFFFFPFRLWQDVTGAWTISTRLYGDPEKIELFYFHTVTTGPCVSWDPRNLPTHPVWHPDQVPVCSFCVSVVVVSRRLPVGTTTRPPDVGPRNEPVKVYSTDLTLVQTRRGVSALREPIRVLYSPWELVGPNPGPILRYHTRPPRVPERPVGFCPLPSEGWVKVDSTRQRYTKHQSPSCALKVDCFPNTTTYNI